jgi:hypothetical protein
MIVTTAAARNAIHTRRPTSARLLITSISCWAVFALLTIESAQAVPTITLAAGVQNPPPSLTSLVPETAVADKATLVPVANFSAVLQSTLNAQGFTAANNWTLVDNAAPLDNNATFNITDYHLFLNGTSTKFGENMDFRLNPNLAQPANVPAGSTATLHWLQMLNEDKKYGNFGFPIAGQQGFWQVDNGDINGGAAAGAATGPYYDSNAPGFSVPPSFHDAPQFYSGVGTYLHFTAIPTWDIFTPAAGETPAKESINVANYGLAWGFVIVPEPASFVLIVIGCSAVCGVRLRKEM